MSRAIWQAGLCAAAGCALVACTTARSHGQELPAAFSTIRDVPLPGDTSRFDYQSLDPRYRPRLPAIANLGGHPVLREASLTTATGGDDDNLRSHAPPRTSGHSTRPANPARVTRIGSCTLKRHSTARLIRPMAAVGTS